MCPYLILFNRSAFSLSEWDFGFNNFIANEIETENEEPVRQPLHRQPLTLLPIIDHQVERCESTKAD